MQKEAQDDLAKGDLTSAKEQLLGVLATDDNDGGARESTRIHFRATGRHSLRTASGTGYLLEPESADVH